MHARALLVVLLVSSAGCDRSTKQKAQPAPAFDAVVAEAVKKEVVVVINAAAINATIILDAAIAPPANASYSRLDDAARLNKRILERANRALAEAQRASCLH